ncbi:MAG: hypothetical protein ACR2M9_01895, partial [Cyanophyceae cyanobacterium]
MNRYMKGMGAYEQGAAEINSNLASYRADVDNIKSQNKSLIETAKQTTDLNALRDLGAEVGVRTIKKFAGKVGGKLYSYKLGERGSLEEWDKKMGQRLTKFGKRKLGLGGDADEIEESGEGVEMTGNPTASTVQENLPEGGEAESGLGEEVGGEVENPGTFDEFMEQFDVPRQPNGDIDFDRANEQINMGQEDRASRQMRETKEDTGEESKEPEDEGEGEDAAEDVGEDVGEDAAEDVGGDAAAEGVGAGLEAAGAALDATGVLAPVGLLMNAVGAVVEGGVIVKGVEDAVDWFK